MAGTVAFGAGVATLALPVVSAPRGPRDEVEPCAGPCSAGRDHRAARRARRRRGGLPRRLWRADNYLTVGQIYLMANPLLREPLTAEHIKPRLLGHWGTSPGLSFVYAHASRLSARPVRSCSTSPAPGTAGRRWWPPATSRGPIPRPSPRSPRTPRGCGGCSGSSPPRGIPSHVSVTTPGSIHEGGELGYVLAHAFGAVMDNPDLVALAVVGDGEAETGPLEGSEGHLLPQPGAGRRGAARPPPQRGQDRRPDRAGPQGPGRGALAARGARVRRPRGRGGRPPRHAPPLRRRAGAGVVADPRHPGVRTRR